MQLYKVVVDMPLYEPALFKCVVPLCGGMHWLFAAVHFVAVLLSPALKPSLASKFGSVDKMLSGKKYPQNLQAFRMLAEEFLRSTLENNPYIKTYVQLVKHLEAESKKSKTTKLLVNGLIKPIFIMLAFVRAAREQDFPLHDASSKAMLPIFAAPTGKFYP